MKSFIFSVLFFTPFLLFSQDSTGIGRAYLNNVLQAEKLFAKKDYLNAANYYSLAFIANNGIGKVSERYNAACCWASTNNLDSAFFQLIRIATRGKFMDYDMLLSDKKLLSLRTDKRWVIVIEKVKANAKEFEDKLTNGNVFDLQNQQK